MRDLQGPPRNVVFGEQTPNAGRGSGHGLSDRETRVMMLYDGGERDFGVIAAKTGYGVGYVASVIGRYAVTEYSLSAFDKMARAGTASLLAALHTFHPETRQGIHP